MNLAASVKPPSMGRPSKVCRQASISVRQAWMNEAHASGEIAVSRLRAAANDISAPPTTGPLCAASRAATWLISSRRQSSTLPQ